MHNRGCVLLEIKSWVGPQQTYATLPTKARATTVARKVFIMKVRWSLWMKFER